MKRSRRVLLPPRFAARLPEADQLKLEALQAGLVAHLEAAEPEFEEDTVDPWQTAADLAQWYLVIGTEPGSSSVTIDSDRCVFMLGEAAAQGCQPTRSGVEEQQRQWQASSRWPCFPGDGEPPLLRGG